jgi:hypothetical protein
LFTHIRLGFPCGLFPSGFPTNISHAFLLFLFHANCLAHLIVLDFIIIVVLCEEHKLRSFSLCSFLQPSVISSLWSESLAADPEVPGSIPGHYKKKTVVGLERGLLSLVSTTEELLGRISSGSGLESRECGRRDSSR